MAEYGDLLGEAMGPESGACVVVVEDCIEASGAFVLHLLLKRALAAGGFVAFLALAQPFSHYDRVLRKMGCNLSVQKKNERLHFFDLLQFPGETRQNATDHCFLRLYHEIQVVVEAHSSKECNAGGFTIMIDDLSLLEVAAHGSVDDVLNLLHYCVTITSEMDCSLIILNHEDIYSGEEDAGLLSRLRYLADTVIRVAPLNTGLAADVHGQLSVVNKGIFSEHRQSARKVWIFHFKVKENGVEFFYPGSRH